MWNLRATCVCRCACRYSGLFIWVIQLQQWIRDKISCIVMMDLKCVPPFRVQIRNAAPEKRTRFEENCAREQSMNIVTTLESRLNRVYKSNELIKWVCSYNWYWTSSGGRKFCRWSFMLGFTHPWGHLIYLYTCIIYTEGKDTRRNSHMWLLFYRPFKKI